MTSVRTETNIGHNGMTKQRQHMEAKAYES